MSRVKYYNPTYPDGKLKMFTTSYDDGLDCDAKLVEILRKHGCKGTFNVNSGLYNDEEEADARWRRLSLDEMLDVYGEDMEIAVHGALHPWWDRQSPVNAMADILDDRRAIEHATGRIIRGAAFPWGTYNDDVVEILRQAGFAYCRTAAATKKCRATFSDPLRYCGTVRNRDPQAVELAKHFVDMKTTDGIVQSYYLWGHTYEFVDKDSWNVAEEIISIVGDREDVWYCTNIEYFDYMAATRELRYNVDGTVVENPTATDIWLQGNHQYFDPEPVVVKVPAGQTVKLEY